MDIGRPDVGRLETIGVYERAASDRLIADLEAARDRLSAAVAAAREQLRVERERAGTSLLEVCQALATRDEEHRRTIDAVHRAAEREADERIERAQREAASLRSLVDRLGREDSASVLDIAGRVHTR